MPKDDQDIVEVRCPKCNEKVRVARATAEREFKAKCPNGHEVALVKAL
jgi:phage FluMu protein Com